MITSSAGSASSAVVPSARSGPSEWDPGGCSGGDVLRGEDPAAPVGEEALSSEYSFWCSSGEHHLNPRLRMVRPRELQLGGAERWEIVQSPQTPRGATQLVE